MADQQITDLPVATEAEDADLLLMRQGSTDKQITKAILFAESLSTLNNLSDVVNKATARTNLDVPQTNTVLLKANNLSDVANAATARDNLGVEIGADVQGYTAQLAALSANNTVTGLHAQTGTDTVASRTIVASSSKITVVNGSGAAGNPGIDVAEANLNMNNTGTTLGVPKGGTGATTLTGILKGNGTSAVTAGATVTVPEGGTGSTTLTGILKGNGTSAVTAGATVTVPEGGSGVTSLTAFGLVAGGTTTTGNVQVIAPTTINKILRGGGTGALPVFDAGILPVSAVYHDTTVNNLQNLGFAVGVMPWAMPPVSNGSGDLGFFFQGHATQRKYRFFPLFIPYDTVLQANNSGYRFAIKTADSGKEITMCLYNDSGDHTGPIGAPIANTTKSSSFTTTGSISLPFTSDVTLAAGLYWYGIASDSLNVGYLWGYANTSYAGLITLGSSGMTTSSPWAIVQAVGFYKDGSYSSTMPTITAGSLTGLEVTGAYTQSNSWVPMVFIDRDT